VPWPRQACFTPPTRGENVPLSALPDFPRQLGGLTMVKKDMSTKRQAVLKADERYTRLRRARWRATVVFPRGLPHARYCRVDLRSALGLRKDYGGAPPRFGRDADERVVGLQHACVSSSTYPSLTMVQPPS